MLAENRSILTWYCAHNLLEVLERNGTNEVQVAFQAVGQILINWSALGESRHPGVPIWHWRKDRRRLFQDIWYTLRFLKKTKVVWHGSWCTSW
jgi:hypothetical protein